MDLSSDSQILSATRKEGELWVFPDLNFKAQMGQGRPFDQAVSWCNAVRGEHERQESKRIAEGERKGSLARAAGAADTTAPLGGGSYGPVAQGLPAPKAKIQASDAERYFVEQTDALCEAIVDLDMEILEHEAAMNDAIHERRRVQSLLSIFEKTLEEIIGTTTQEVLPAVGGDIRPEVHSAGKRRRRGVGNKDDTQASAQEVSASSEGSDGAATTSSD
jgi:hypothetical protein